MRLFACMAIAAIVSGCSQSEDAIKACETNIMSKLRSPSTYKRISGNALVDEQGHEIHVMIEYDAENAYGTPIREQDFCRFVAPNDNFSPERDFLGQVSDSSARGDEICCSVRANREADDAIGKTTDAAENLSSQR